MLYNPSQYLPTAEELPETDHTAVDSQLQMLVEFVRRNPSLALA